MRMYGVNGYGILEGKVASLEQVVRDLNSKLRGAKAENEKLSSNNGQKDVCLLYVVKNWAYLYSLFDIITETNWDAGETTHQHGMLHFINRMFVPFVVSPDFVWETREFRVSPGPRNWRAEGDAAG